MTPFPLVWYVSALLTYAYVAGYTSKADMYPPPHMTCMYPPPHMTCMHPFPLVCQRSADIRIYMVEITLWVISTLSVSDSLTDIVRQKGAERNL
jgi:hypothetical protein